MRKGRKHSDEYLNSGAQQRFADSLNSRKFNQTNFE